MRPNELWEGHSLKMRLLRTLLTPLSWLYAFGWQSYLLIYNLGVKRASRPHRPVICIGNLVTGGSGKSPLTLYVAKLLVESGRTVVLGCSGYGAPHAEAAEIAPLGPLSAAEWGDEPAMFRWLLPDVPIVVGRRRVLAGELVHQAFPDAVLVMDDGFQHLPLRKDLTLLLDDPRPTNSRCLPAGPYREPRNNRRRADEVLPGRFRVVSERLDLVKVDGELEIPTAYSVLCALGQPQRFLDQLQSSFPRVAGVGKTLLLSDHDPLQGGTLLEEFPVALPIIVTAKDWVKLRLRPDVGSRQFIVAGQRIRVEPEADFKKWLKERVDE